MTKGGENSWGHMLLDMMTEHTRTQGLQQKTRFRNDKQPSKLDLIFTKDPGTVN